MNCESLAHFSLKSCFVAGGISLLSDCSWHELGVECAHDQVVCNLVFSFYVIYSTPDHPSNSFSAVPFHTSLPRLMFK